MTRNHVLSGMGLAGLLVLAGCIQSKTVVTVEKDGSGTVEQTVYTKDLNFAMAGAKKPSPEQELAAARAKAAETAKSMGEGVTLKTVERIAPRDGWKGMRIVYAFPDVAEIRVNPMPEVSFGGVEAGAQGAGVPGPKEEDKEQVRFQFTPGPAPKLTMLMPPMTPPEEAQASAAGQDEQAQAMAKAMLAQFLDGMRLEFQVKVGGKITQTNATYVSQNRQVVGLFRMDFGALTKAPGAMDKMMSMENATTPEEMEKQLQDPEIAKYVKIETKPQVEVTFE